MLTLSNSPSNPWSPHSTGFRYGAKVSAQRVHTSALPLAFEPSAPQSQERHQKISGQSKVGFTSGFHRHIHMYIYIYVCVYIIMCIIYIYTYIVYNISIYIQSKCIRSGFYKRSINQSVLKKEEKTSSPGNMSKAWRRTTTSVFVSFSSSMDWPKEAWKIQRSKNGPQGLKKNEYFGMQFLWIFYKHNHNYSGKKSWKISQLRRVITMVIPVIPTCSPNFTPSSHCYLNPTASPFICQPAPSTSGSESVSSSSVL